MTMANPVNNPLFKHFRQPAIYLKLPSGGRYYPDGSIDLPVAGDIPVYPMTVKDELTLKTPDALMNGQGIVDMVKSCCPNIKDPWMIPTIDLDPIFIAIRLASYGHGMDIITTCPHCKTKNEYTIDLRRILDGTKGSGFENPVKIDGLTFKFKPQQYKHVNNANLITFEEQRLVDRIINNTSLSDEQKKAQFDASFEKITKMNVETVVSSIEHITTEDGTVVSDPAQIVEYLNECSRKTYNDIRESVLKAINSNKLDDLELTCDNEECGKEYKSELSFDQANFFA
jgi:hypothetical protein